MNNQYLTELKDTAAPEISESRVVLQVMVACSAEDATQVRVTELPVTIVFDSGASYIADVGVSRYFKGVTLENVEVKRFKM